MATKGRLGRGLSALIPANSKTEADLRHISVYNIIPNPKQPRKDFDGKAFDDLADTVKEIGVIQPVVVRQKNNTFEIIAGERRWRAAKKAGLKTIPCVVKKASEEVSLQMALIENIQRQNLNPIEEAEAYESLLNGVGMTQDELAKAIGISRPYITNTLRLLRLPEPVKEQLINGKISAGHARTIASLKDEKTQISLANKIINKGLSVRETEKAVDSLWHPAKEKEKLVNVLKEQEMLSKALGLKVSVRQNNDRGVVSIYYEDDKQLNDIVRRITRN